MAAVVPDGPPFRLIYAPPCSGKTTFCEENRCHDGDVLLSCCGMGPDRNGDAQLTRSWHILDVISTYTDVPVAWSGSPRFIAPTAPVVAVIVPEAVMRRNLISRGDIAINVGLRWLAGANLVSCKKYSSFKDLPLDVFTGTRPGLLTLSREAQPIPVGMDATVKDENGDCVRVEDGRRLVVDDLPFLLAHICPDNYAGLSHDVAMRLLRDVEIKENCSVTPTRDVRPFVNRGVKLLAPALRVVDAQFTVPFATYMPVRWLLACISAALISWALMSMVNLSFYLTWNVIFVACAYYSWPAQTATMSRAGYLTAALYSQNCSVYGPVLLAFSFAPHWPFGLAAVSVCLAHYLYGRRYNAIVSLRYFPALVTAYEHEVGHCNDVTIDANIASTFRRFACANVPGDTMSMTLMHTKIVARSVVTQTDFIMLGGAPTDSELYECIVGTLSELALLKEHCRSQSPHLCSPVSWRFALRLLEVLAALTFVSLIGVLFASLLSVPAPAITFSSPHSQSMEMTPSPKSMAFRSDYYATFPSPTFASSQPLPDLSSVTSSPLSQSQQSTVFSFLSNGWETLRTQTREKTDYALDMIHSAALYLQSRSYMPSSVSSSLNFMDKKNSPGGSVQEVTPPKASGDHGVISLKRTSSDGPCSSSMCPGPSEPPVSPHSGVLEFTSTAPILRRSNPTLLPRFSRRVSSSSIGGS